MFKPFLHTHDAHAGLFVAGQDGALDGSGAAPARQQRGVHVQTAMLGDGQHLGRKQHAVSGHADDIGLERRERLLLVGVAQRLGREHGDAALARLYFHGAGHELLAAAAHGVGARVDGNHFVLRGKLREHRRGEVGRAHEYDAHAPYASTEVSPGRAPAARARS